MKSNQLVCVFFSELSAVKETCVELPRSVDL